MALAVAKIAAAMILKPTSWESVFSAAVTVADDPDDEWCRYVASGFSDLCRYGHVRTSYRPLGGGNPIPMPLDWWDCEDTFLRFRTFGVDPDHPFSSRHDLPCWIYVADDSLADATEVIRRRKHGIADPVIVPTAGEFVGIPEALDILRPHLAMIRASSPGSGPEGAPELLAALQAGVVGAVALEARRFFSVANAPPKIVDRRRDWRIPSVVWQRVRLSPSQNWAAGNFVTSSENGSIWHFDGIAIVRVDILKYLEGMGQLVRIQARPQGTDHVHEGFATLDAAEALFREPEVSGPEETVAMEPWTPERMKQEILTCGHADREEAWREHFGPNKSEHGWKNQAFRDFWSQARGTVGMTGRPHN